MNHIYIAGPYRAETSWAVEQNIRRAEEIGFLVACAEAVPVIPHTMYRHFDGTLTDEYWLKATQSLLRRCDGIVLLPGWALSEGSCGERELANRLGLPMLDLASVPEEQRLKELRIFAEGR